MMGRGACGRSFQSQFSGLIEVQWRSGNCLISRLAVGFYCLGIMDLLGTIDKQNPHQREEWRTWIWEQQTRMSLVIPLPSYVWR